MKKTYLTFALLSSALAVSSCVDEIFVEEKPIYDTTPGNEIMFTASANYGSDVPKTKTVYGDTSLADKEDANNPGKKGTIEINWVEGDKVSIVSPQAQGADVAHYEVIPSETQDGTYQGAHAAALLRLGDAGLQWTSEVGYDFYAVYPTVLDNNSASLTKEGVFTGVMPREQTYLELKPATDEKSGKSGKVAVPNMDNAFMTATGWYSRINENGTQNTNAVNLQFESLVTALQFDITAGALTNLVDKNNHNTKIESLDILSVSLTSAKHNIAGNFECVFQPSKKVSYTNTSTSTSNVVTMNFDDPISLGSGEFLDATFFILPETIEAKDLTLRILFKLGTSTLSRSAIINKEIIGGKKYCFNDVQLEDFSGTIDGGSWFDTLAPEILMSQLSIPVASNVFATKDNGFDGSNSQQQVMTLDELWSVGVRGFELVNRRTVTIRNTLFNGKQYTTNNDWTLADAHFVVDENPHETLSSDRIDTFGEAFEALAAKLQQNPDEFLAIFCTYQAVNDGYDPDGYVRQLLNYLDEYSAAHPTQRFIQITSTTTVEQAKGAIAIIIRPGDDDRYQTNYGSSATKLTANIPLTSKNSNDWSGSNPDKCVTLIADWGTAFDVWDRRYEGVARESTFETSYHWGSVRRQNGTPLTQIEDWLWGVGSDNSGNYSNLSGEYNFNAGKDWPTKREQFNYEHSANNGIKAFVQEWARVAVNGSIPDYSNSVGYSGVYNRYRNTNAYLYFNWPDSFVEKKKAIDGLFELSVKELNQKNQSVYVNSLSGYLIDKSAPGFYPFKQEHEDYAFRSGNFTFVVNNQGKGGNHARLAYELNKYVYDILSGDQSLTTTGAKLAPGPWGYVIIEHIGNKSEGQDDKSLDLVDLIMMNNFRIDLGKTSIDSSVGVDNWDIEIL